jgi:hypothetical protein
MSTIITAGNPTNGLSLSADNTGILEFKTGNGAGTTALTLSSTQVATFASSVTNINLAAGTTTVAPLQFQSGALLTTALAGTVNYDGKVFYATPQGAQRGVIPGQQFFRLDSNLAGANATGAQNVFGVGVTLSASTVYEFEAMYVLSKTAGTTQSLMGLGFGGTATINNILYQVSVTIQLGALPQTSTGNFQQSATVNTATNFTVVDTVGSTTAIRSHVYIIRGAVSINAGGTFIPQYTLTVAPGGAFSTVAGSFFSIYPVGASGANTNVGTWA